VLPEYLGVAHVTDVLEASIYQLEYIHYGGCSLADVAIILLVVNGLLELNVDQCVLDVFVPKEPHNIHDVFGLVVECRHLPLSEGVEWDP